MVKSSGKKSVTTLWRVPLATLACLILLICMEAELVHKGVLSMEAAEIGNIISCLISGTVGTLFKAKGEEDRNTKLLASVLPGLILLISGLALVRNSHIGYTPFVHTACLILPGLLSVLFGQGRRKGRLTRKRRRHVQFR